MIVYGSPNDPYQFQEATNRDLQASGNFVAYQLPLVQLVVGLYGVALTLNALAKDGA